MSTFLTRIKRGFAHLEYCDELRRCFFVFREPVRMIAGYLGLPIWYPFICETKSGVRIRVAGRTDLATVWIIFLRHEYAVKVDDEVIVDCGANIGVFALYATAVAPKARVFAVEPFPSTFEDLCGNVNLNSLDERVMCIRAALAAGDGKVNMYAEAHVPSQARQVIQPSGSDTVSVSALSLSSLLTRIGVGKVDLLKMDIEGSEHPALLSADPSDLARVKRLSVEYHQTGPKGPLFVHIESAGFVLRHDRILGHNYGVAEFVRLNGSV
jgi:FkbM family methyltransferase